MTIENARSLVPQWSMPQEDPKNAERRRTVRMGANMKIDVDQFMRKYGILMILAAAFTIYSIILSAYVESRTEKRIWAEAKTYYDQQLLDYQNAQALEAQREYWLSGQASFEAYLNQVVERGAHFISEEKDDDQYKGTKLGVAIARHMNSAYPDDLIAVMDQPSQWLRSSADSKITQHDLDLSEKIIRPYLESGIIPNGLTVDIVYFNDVTGVARDSYENSASMTTWRYQG